MLAENLSMEEKECGCRAEWEGNGIVVVFCRMHEMASELLEELKDISENSWDVIQKVGRTS